jgi:hypothetical protein
MFKKLHSIDCNHLFIAQIRVHSCQERKWKQRSLQPYYSSKSTLFKRFIASKNTLFKRNNQIKAKKYTKKTKNPIQISKLYNLNSQKHKYLLPTLSCPHYNSPSDFLLDFLR